MLQRIPRGKNPSSSQTQYWIRITWCLYKKREIILSNEISSYIWWKERVVVFAHCLKRNVLPSRYFYLNVCNIASVPDIYLFQSESPDAVLGQRMRVPICCSQPWVWHTFFGKGLWWVTPAIKIHWIGLKHHKGFNRSCGPLSDTL